MRTRVPISLQCCILILSFATAGCANVRSPVIDAPPESLRSIYVVRRGWHTAIAIASSDWPNRNWSLLNDFAEADYLEFGWGDERYYQAERATAWLAVRAALWPTSSVIHVIGVREPLPDNAQARAVVEVPVPAPRLRALAAAIEQEFTSNDPAPTGATLRTSPAPNRFYKAHRNFHFLRMCNWWTATLLQKAGCPIAPTTVIFAARVVDEARECAVRLGDDDD